MISKLIEKLKSSKKRRELFVAGQIKTGIPFQVRALRDKMGWTQVQLGNELGMTQTNVSRLESPGYGRLNITTLQRIAAVFDVALIVRFVSFSELVRWVDNLSPEVIAPESFERELEIEQQMTASTSWSQGSFAHTTYIAPHGSFDIGDISHTESYYKELRQKMGLSSVSEDVSPTLRALTLGPVGFDKPLALSERLKGTVLSLDYSYWVKDWVKETSNEMPEIDYTGEADPESTQSTATETYKNPIASIFVRGGSTQHVN